MKHFFILFCTLVLSSCAYTTQEANLTANVDVGASDIGGDTLLKIKVVDERTSLGLGNRGSAMMKGAKITSDQDIPGLIQSALLEAYTLKSFSVTEMANLNPVNMRIDLRELNYSTSTGFWTGGVHTIAAAKVSVEDNEFEKMFTSENEERVMFVPGAGKNEKLLNQILNDLITKIVNDQELTQALISVNKKGQVAD